MTHIKKKRDVFFKIFSTESDVYIRITKAWPVTDRLSIIGKFDPSDKRKTGFLLSGGCVSTTVWMNYLNANEMHGEKAGWELDKKKQRAVLNKS